MSAKAKVTVRARYWLTLLTPTATGTLLGPLLIYGGQELWAGVALAVVGIGGVALALGLGIQRDGLPWWWGSVVRELGQALTLRDPATLVGLLTHIPQAVWGMWLLVR